ncbi:26899_t:CDS:1, partial [Gigaspora margarita]
KNDLLNYIDNNVFSLNISNLKTFVSLSSIYNTIITFFGTLNTYYFLTSTKNLLNTENLLEDNLWTDDENFNPLLNISHN